MKLSGLNPYRGSRKASLLLPNFLSRKLQQPTHLPELPALPVVLPVGAAKDRPVGRLS